MAGEKNQKLLVEFIFRPKSNLVFGRSKYPIQNKPFFFGLIVTNNDDKIFEGAVIKNFGIKSAEQKDLSHYFEKKEFSIRLLNPGESIEIWWPKAMSTYLEGLAWAYCDIIPNSKENEIVTYQIDASTGAIEKYREINKWADSIYIERKFELEQSRTNSLIFVLTVLTFLEGLFGIKNIFNFVISQFQSLFFLLASLFGGLKIY